MSAAPGVAPSSGRPRAASRAPRLLALAAVVVLVVVGGVAGLSLLGGRDGGGTGPDQGSPGAGTGAPGVAAAGTEGPTPRATGPVWTGERTPGPEDAEEGTPGPVPAELPPPEEGPVPPPETTEPMLGNVTLGSTGSPVSVAIGPGGGVVAAPGIEITVAPGALGTEVPFTVTPTPIEGIAAPDAYGGAITPVTPLFSVSTGDAELAAPARVVITMPLPDPAAGDTIPMAFYRDPATGDLSPLTTVAAADGALTVLAPHFSELFGAHVALALVPSTVDSGFRPGADDWQFANYGSYVAPGGQCEGQSITEIWYYLRQRLGAGASPLFGLYDNNGAPEQTPTFWQDDSDGYRYVGSVHSAGIADTAAYLAMRDPQWDAADSRFTFDAFRVAVALSGSPQMIRISPAPGDAGHTMIVYRVTPNRLYVADPNFPGKLRTIPYDAATGKLAMYSSGDSATAIGQAGTTSYTRFAYVPWVASKTEAWVADRWADFEQNAAGDRAYPNYELRVAAGKDEAGKDVWVELKDGFVTADPTLRVQLTKLGDGAATSMLVYRGTSSKPLGAWAWKQDVALEPGENALGFLVYGKKGTQWGYVDFVRVRVVLGGVTLVFEPVEDVCPLVGTSYTYAAKATGIPPTVKQVSFAWDFGGGPQAAETYAAPFATEVRSQGTHTWEAEGDGKAIVILSDTSGATPVELARTEIGLPVYVEGSMLWTLCTHEIEP